MIASEPCLFTRTLPSALEALHCSRRASLWRATQTRGSCSSRSSATLYFAASNDLSARHTCARRLREAGRASSTRTARLRAVVPLARRPPAAAAASPPLTRACLISAYSDVHSGRPLERAPRLARAHRAALARPSAAQAPSRVPLGRYIAIDAPPCGARCRPEATA